MHVSLPLIEKISSYFYLRVLTNLPSYHNIPLSGARMGLQTYLATAELGKPTVIPRPNEIRYSYFLNTTTPNSYLPDKLDPADPHLGAYGTLEYPVQGFHTHITAMLKYDARKDREVLYFSQVDGNHVQQSWWEFDEKHRLGFMGRFDGWWVCTDIVIPDGMKRGIVWMDGKRGRKDKCTKVEIRKSEWDR